MFSRPALVVFGVAVVEFFLFVYLVRAFGAIPITLLAILLSVSGLYYLVRFTPKALRRGFRQLVDSGGDVSTKDAGDQAARVVAGLLLAVPGILTGVGGLLLLVKPIRNLLSPAIGMHVVQYVPTGPIQAITPFGRRGRGNIIDVDVVDVDGYSSKTEPTSSNPPELL